MLNNTLPARPVRNASRGIKLAAAIDQLRDALAEFCRADGALEAAWAVGSMSRDVDCDALSDASAAAAVALQAAYTPAYRAFKAAPDTAATARAASVLAEAERIARQSVLTLTR